MVMHLIAAPGVPGVPGAPPCAGLAPGVATEVRLTDGATVYLRDACADAPRLREMFFTLSDTTRFFYFCAGVPRNDIWAERVARLSIADGYTSYAMVAEAGGKLVGVARFDRDKQGSRAEIGILVTDAWQSRGLGRQMLARLHAEATGRALTGFTALVLGENRRAMRLLRGAFPTMQASFSYGQFTIDMPFAPESVPARER